MTASISTGLAVLGGVLTVLSPCILPILPVLVGRSLQSHPYGPVALVAGLVGGFAVAGSLLGVTASWFTGKSKSVALWSDHPPFNLRTAGNLPNLELSLVQLPSHRQAPKRTCTNWACGRVLVRDSTWVAVDSLCWTNFGRNYRASSC